MATQTECFTSGESAKLRKWGGSMNAIISKEPMGASSVGEWVKLGERQLSSSQSTYNTFCDFSDIYEAISVIHATYIIGRANAGLVCSSYALSLSSERAYYYVYLGEALEAYTNFTLSKHFWKHQFYSLNYGEQRIQSIWCPEPNAGFGYNTPNVWSSIYPDALYQSDKDTNELGITGTQTIYGLKIS